MFLPSPDSRVVVLSGAGLSAASGIPTFRGEDGLWEGHDVFSVATPEAWFQDATLVRRFYDARRTACAAVSPNPGHEALAALQAAWGPERVRLVTQNVDGLLQRAGAKEVIEMHGSLWELQCEADPNHPRHPVQGPQDAAGHCPWCHGRLRPAVVWFGEIPRHMDRIHAALVDCDVFVSVGTSGVVYPAAGFVRIARQVGARCIEVNPAPSGGPFDDVVAEGSESALPRLVAAWGVSPRSARSG